MRSAVRMLIVALGLAALSPVARAGDEPLPSRPTMRYQAPAVLGEGVVDLTLTDAVFLGLRANRGIRSAYLTRVAQKFDLRVAEDFFRPSFSSPGRSPATAIRTIVRGRDCSRPRQRWWGNSARVSAWVGRAN